MHFNTRLSRKMEALTSQVIRLTSSNIALLFCFVIVLVWGIDGFIAHFSQQWESVIGTVSSVITVLMVFLIQKAQFKDSLAIGAEMKRSDPEDPLLTKQNPS